MRDACASCTEIPVLQNKKQLQVDSLFSNKKKYQNIVHRSWQIVNYMTNQPVGEKTYISDHRWKPPFDSFVDHDHDLLLSFPWTDFWWLQYLPRNFFFSSLSTNNGVFQQLYMNSSFNNYIFVIH